MQNSMALFTFFVLYWKYPFCANLMQRNQNFKFKLKVGTYTNSNTQNPFFFFFFFDTVLERKRLNRQFKLKFDTWANSNTQNLMVVFILCFRLQILFWANLVQKIKIVSLSGNLVPRQF